MWKWLKLRICPESPCPPQHMEKISMLAFHPVKMQSCYEKVEQLSLEGLQQRFDVSSPSVFVQRAQILMREVPLQCFCCCLWLDLVLFTECTYQFSCENESTQSHHCTIIKRSRNISSQRNRQVCQWSVATTKCPWVMANKCYIQLKHTSE